MQFYFSWERMLGIIIKEFKEMSHDLGTALLIVMIPLVQIILFSYTINNNPKHLPTVIVSADESPMTRKLVDNLKISSYFDIIGENQSPAQADELLKTGKAQFAIYFPPNFTRDLIRGDKPELLIEADATDPASVSYAFSALNEVGNLFFNSFTGSLDFLHPLPVPIDIKIHPKYNPEIITQYNIIPGLLSAILSLSLVVLTALAVVRERENGTMEVLLTTPLRPTEIIVGKMIPYVIIAYIQAVIIILISHYLFRIPIYGSVTLLLFACFPFILANLALGLTFSTISKSQLQATQLTMFYFLPALLFSGFMFPFHGLPEWGQMIGQLFPGTHFLIITRGIMLKGSGIYEIYPHLIAISLFFMVFLMIAIKRFHKTLD
jgi:ABC-2 type transport system permease protein